MLIKRKDVIDTLDRFNCCGYVEEKCIRLVETIKALPSAQPKFPEDEICGEGETAAYKEGWNDAIDTYAQRKGKWIVDDEYIDCSYCRHEKWSRVPYEQLVSRFRFCPNCGADMRGEEDD